MRGSYSLWVPYEQMPATTSDNLGNDHKARSSHVKAVDNLADALEFAWAAALWLQSAMGKWMWYTCSLL